MPRLDAFDIQRELLTVEQKLLQIRDSFIGYAAGEETVPEVVYMDGTIKRVRQIQAKMRAWFAP